jgi:hypothetical protein
MTNSAITTTMPDAYAHQRRVAAETARRNFTVYEPVDQNGTLVALSNHRNYEPCRKAQEAWPDSICPAWRDRRTMVVEVTAEIGLCPPWCRLETLVPDWDFMPGNVVWVHKGWSHTRKARFAAIKAKAKADRDAWIESQKPPLDLRPSWTVFNVLDLLEPDGEGGSVWPEDALQAGRWRPDCLCDWAMRQSCPCPLGIEQRGGDDDDDDDDE